MSDEDELFRMDEPEPEGFRWVAVPDEGWRVIGEGGNCRRPHCEGRAVAMLKRGKSGWWRYCSDHLYGRWIEGDRVMMRRAQPIED